MLMKKQFAEEVEGALDVMRTTGEESLRDGMVSRQTLDAAAHICMANDLMSTTNAYWNKERSCGGDQPS